MSHIFPILLFLLIISKAQLAICQYDQPSSSSSSSTFEPSLFVVIGVLSLVFSTTFILIFYAKFCHNGIHFTSIHNADHFPDPASVMFGPHTRFSGIERSLVESLPFFRFSSLKGSYKHGLQCSVCLAEFEEIQTLRLLPKCKHGFHIECIDQWLESHSSCPLCRQRVTPEDLTAFANISNSMRLLNPGGKAEDQIEEDLDSLIFELVLSRENQNHNHQPEHEKRHSLEIQTQHDQEKKGSRVLHRLNHQIVISDVMFKNRWSNVTSSDLMFLSSEMLRTVSSERFSSVKCYENDEISSSSRKKGSLIMLGDKRVMSEITGFSRVKDLMGVKSRTKQCLEEANDDVNDDYGAVREDIKRKLWFPIAKRTVEWFANREKNRNQLQIHCQETGHVILDV